MNESSNVGRFVITALVGLIGFVLMFILNLATGQEVVRFHFIWLYFSIIYVALSWRWFEQVQAGNNAVLQRFGKNVATLKPGLPFAPLGIYKLVTVNMQLQQKELPDEPENIWLGDLDQIPAGKRPAVRVPFRDNITEAQAAAIFGNNATAPDGTVFRADVPNDGLSRRVTAPVVPVVEYQVTDPELFITRFKDEEDLKKVLEDEVFRVINMHLPNMSAGQALANKAWINSHLMFAIEARINRDRAADKNWGVDILGAYIKNIPLHHGLNAAIGEASEAEFRGRAEKELLIKKGEGTASAARNLEAEKLKGRAEGLQEAVTKTGLTAQEILAAEVARAVGESGSTVVVGGDGFGQLFGIAAATLGNKTKQP